MFDISKVHISSRARIKDINFPKYPSAELAYFCGLLAGDGHIGIREHKKDYHVELAGNPKDEKELYDDVVCPLVKKLFNIDVKPGQLQDTYGIRIRSIALVNYLTEVLGLPKNRKYNQLKIPEWVKRDRKLIMCYVRGLADTDFCLSLKKRYKTQPYYPVITGVSKSKRFIEEVALVLEKFELKISRHYDIKVEDVRFKKGFAITHRIYLYGHKQLIKWMQTIGFSSPKHLAKFILWKERNVNSNRKKTIEAVAAFKKIR